MVVGRPLFGVWTVGVGETREAVAGVEEDEEEEEEELEEDDAIDSRRFWLSASLRPRSIIVALSYMYDRPRYHLCQYLVQHDDIIPPTASIKADIKMAPQMMLLTFSIAAGIATSSAAEHSACLECVIIEVNQCLIPTWSGHLCLQNHRSMHFDLSGSPAQLRQHGRHQGSTIRMQNRHGSTESVESQSITSAMHEQLRASWRCGDTGPQPHTAPVADRAAHKIGLEASAVAVMLDIGFILPPLASEPSSDASAIYPRHFTTRIHYRTIAACTSHY
ncbi:hypothetical protein DOTSEDRAFT_77021 [Dothistroma septosporum NZE10]|uniref:Uncharacterized protein n=1 Tax=Dothistroma septosporum (strain NZE10 / CBS 128990) TaxID=675120 RepID=N1Q3P3_DOTSN|nr:hypothetical protein DOTSEDRAFT_77021 [Dothistroma septosporum NZE10]